MARGKKIRGTTTRAGRVVKSAVARVAADTIQRPNRGKRVQVKGAQTAPEANALRGPSTAGRSAVKQVGPTNIRPAAGGGADSVKVVGEGMPGQDTIARRGLTSPETPGTRQPGSVKQVGPTDADWNKLNRRSGPTMQSEQARYAPKPGGRPISSTRLLKSGVGRAHPYSVFAGQPGSKSGTGSVRTFGPSGTAQTLVNGRRRAFRPEPFAPNADWVTPTRSIVPGS
jgi:hypothetical protein